MRLAVFAALVLAALAGATALAGAARAETGAPALEPDGVWRARGDWTLEPADVVAHANRTIEVSGNLTVGPDAALTMDNVTLAFPAVATGPRTLWLEPRARFEFKGSALLAEGPQDRIVADQAVLVAEACTMRLSQDASVASALEAIAAEIDLTGCQVESNAQFVIRVRGGTLRAGDCDFLRADGTEADIAVEAPGSAVLDTTRWATLRTVGAPQVTGFATVRFFLLDSGGVPQAGNVNGTGPWGEHFTVFTAPNRTAAVRLKWFDYAAAPSEVTLASRTPSLPLTYTAVAPGVGANNSAAPLAAHRVNVTVALLGSFDLAVQSFTLFGKGLEGPPLRRAYYVEINDSQAVLLRVENRGVGRSPPVRFNLTLTALAPDSWAPLESRSLRAVEVPALAPGASANFSVDFLPGPFGGFKDDSGPCFTSVSYTSALGVSLVDNTSEDFALWNNARSFTVVAFEVSGDPTGACSKPGTDLLPYLALSGGAAVAAVAFMTHRFSDLEVARRAARVPPPAAPDDLENQEGPPP